MRPACPGMRDALENLAVLVAIVREGGVRAAATRLGVPRSTVSRRLESLERSLGGPLLRRGPRLALTEVGQATFDRIAAVVDEVDALRAEVTGHSEGVRGRLRVAASGVFAETFLGPVVQRYVLQNPEVGVELFLAVERIDLRELRIDVAFRTSPLEDSDDFSSTPIGNSINGFFASASYLSKHKCPRHPAELGGCATVAVGRPDRALAWRYADAGVERTVSVRPRVVAENFTFVRDAAVAGVGIVRLPIFFAQAAIDAKLLVPVLEPFWHASRVHALYPKHMARVAKTRAFVDVSKRILSKRHG